MSFEVVSEFEKEIAKFYGSPYAIATDSCTHGIEICIKYLRANKIIVPRRTYLSVPMLAHKMQIDLEWKDEKWENYYEIECKKNMLPVEKKLYDAAVLWEENSYLKGTFMCLSFQFQKHLSLGRGGMILTDDLSAKIRLKKMSYDGRLPDIPWRNQNVDTIGYHYYMTPETAQLGLDKLEKAKITTPKKWAIKDWPDLTKMDIFK
mgnify:FL=1|tara:strand:- start:223 stop:837 length:615 start_codon:yes stop_codon:yes gene_type:complete